MAEDMTMEIAPADWVSSNAIIKVLGVGGGGCNAVNTMFRQGITGCSFVVCNTDSMALRNSPVPVKIQMGKGLGAGTDPIKGRNAALDSQKEIEEVVLDRNTQMLFITAGMGGGTGTGAAPVIAKMAKERGILTVAVVTLPFKNEGKKALTRAVDGVKELEKNVDSLLLINNEKLYELKTMMKDSGMALMGYGSGSGKNRIDDAVQSAFMSPLLNDFDLKSAKNVLVNITAGKNDQGLTMDDMSEINEKIDEYTGGANNFKRGLIWEEGDDIGDSIHITSIVTGLKFKDVIGPVKDLGNYILISRDFVYDKAKESAEEGISLQESTSPGRIGYTGAENICTLRYDLDKKPALLVNPGENISELEDIPAIRRK